MALFLGKKIYPKYPYLWTKDEFLEHWYKNMPPPVHRDAERNHERSIIDALRKGIDVPEIVLRDYPEINVDREKSHESDMKVSNDLHLKHIEQVKKDMRDSLNPKEIVAAIKKIKYWTKGYSSKHVVNLGEKKKEYAVFLVTVNNKKLAVFAPFDAKGNFYVYNGEHYRGGVPLSPSISFDMKYFNSEE